MSNPSQYFSLNLMTAISQKMILYLTIFPTLVVVGCQTKSSQETENQNSPTIKRVSSGGNQTAQIRETHFQFREMSNTAKVFFTPKNGEETGHFSILETLGSGVALFDYDNDHDLDLLVLGGGTYNETPLPIGLKPALYRNEGFWTFTDVTEESGISTPPFYSHGVSIADFNNDGWTDFLVSGYGGLSLWENQTDGTFQHVSQTCGLHSDLWNTSTGWGDLNNDGNLDLYVVRYVNWSFGNHPRCLTGTGEREVCGPKDFEDVSDLVFLNQGEGSFQEHSKETGLAEDGKGLAVILADLDLDSSIDIYVANDTTPNFLYWNSGNGILEEAGVSSGTALGEEALADGSMGIDVADFNQDGLPDLWVSNYERQLFALYRNEGQRLFHHVSRHTGISAVGRTYVGFGTLFLDVDLDGDEDLFATNGHVMRVPKNSDVYQFPLLFENLEGTRFENVASGAGEYLLKTHMGRGLSQGDLDNDGDLDLVISHINQPIAILQNETIMKHEEQATRNSTPQQNVTQRDSWLRLKLVGRTSNRDAIGATVTLRTQGRTYMKQIKGGGSYLSSSDLRVTFGLGKQNTIDEVEIRWPSGIKSRHARLRVNEEHRLLEPLVE